jgi:hypothetical protein
MLISATIIRNHTNTHMDPVIDSLADVRLPTGQEVYDGIMSMIDPELMSTQIDHLDEKYVGESPEDRKARYNRYAESFKKYDEMYAEWQKNMNEAVTEYRKESLKSAEIESREEDAAALAQLDSDFNQAL